MNAGLTLHLCKQAVRVATQYDSASCKLTTSSYLFARWHLFRHVGYLRHQQQIDLWPFDLESGVRVTCDMGYLCANFSLSRPLCSRVRPDICDRQTDRQTDRRETDVRRHTDVRQKHRLMPTLYWGGSIKSNKHFNWFCHETLLPSTSQQD